MTAGGICRERLLWGLGPHGELGDHLNSCISKATPEGLDKKETSFYKLVGKRKATELATGSLYLALVADATSLRQHLLTFRAWEWPSPLPQTVCLSQSCRGQQSMLSQNFALNWKTGWDSKDAHLVLRNQPFA